jgi:hypothetical protein
MTGCCERVSDGDAAGGGAGTPVFVREIDFSAEPTQNLVNGNNTIAGDTWTGADVGNASLFRTAAGSGLEFQNAAVSTVYTTATRSASRISIPIRSLLPTFEPWWTLYIEWFYSM